MQRLGRNPRLIGEIDALTTLRIAPQKCQVEPSNMQVRQSPCPTVTASRQTRPWGMFSPPYREDVLPAYEGVHGQARDISAAISRIDKAIGAHENLQ